MRLEEFTAPTITQPQQLALHAALGAAISTSLGGDALSGAISGAISELSASESLKNGTTPQNAILIGQATGAASALLTSELQGKNDEQTAKNIQLGGMIGANAAANNAVKVWVQEVAAGNYHTSIKIEPEDQEGWKNDPKYGKVFNNYDPEKGKYYATIGGGPDTFSVPDLLKGKWLGNLIGGETYSGELDGINRSRDINLNNKVWESQNIISISSENIVIEKLFEANRNYTNDLKYNLFPSPTSNNFNSNSYTTGILNSVGINPPELPTSIVNVQWHGWEYDSSPAINLQYVLPKYPTPGYNKPVPSKYFQ